MIKIRKTTCFKFTALIMAFLFIFQADFLLSVKNTTDYEKQYELAEKEFYQGQYQGAKVRLLRLINVLNKQEKQEKILLKKVNALLEKIRKGPQVIEQEGKKKKNGKKRKKFPTLLVVLGVIATGAAIYFLATKKKTKYNLTVSKGEGISGSPGSGTYSYRKDETISYNYTLQSGYVNLVVRLDGQTVPVTGTIKMDRNHTLSVTADKIGTITGVTIKFTVRFVGTNLKVTHQVRVDGSTKINKTFRFDVPSSSQWDVAKKYYETFYVNRGLGNMEIRQIADSDYSSYYSGSLWIWSTRYNLEITDYTYTDGIDPGNPRLSDESFYLNVCPWISDNPAWDSDQSNTITINAPSNSITAASRIRGKNQVPLEDENNRICSDSKK